jgi:hypothetical protein
MMIILNVFRRSLSGADSGIDVRGTPVQHYMRQ